MDGHGDCSGYFGQAEQRLQSVVEGASKPVRGSRIESARVHPLSTLDALRFTLTEMVDVSDGRLTVTPQRVVAS